MSKARRYLPYINLVLNALILVSIALSYLTLKADHERRRKEMTVKLYDTWRDVFDTKEGRVAVLWFTQHRITEPEAKKLIEGQLIDGVTTKEQGDNLRYQAFRILNFLEEVAVCYRDDVAESKMIDNYFGHSVPLYWDHLKNIAIVWRESNPHAWVELEEVIVTKWKAQPSTPTQKGP